jgi:hypothetical protein
MYKSELIKISRCSDYVLIHTKPDARLPRTLSLLDLLLHERKRSTTKEINESQDQAFQRGKAQGRLTKKPLLISGQRRGKSVSGLSVPKVMRKMAL